MNSNKSKTVISLCDDSIKYITLSKNDYGFYIKNYDSAELESGIIKNGEILKADFLSKILKKIYKKIDVKSVDLIIPHEYFLFDLHVLENKKKQNVKKILKKYLKENKSKISWASSHAYEYDVFDEKELKILFRAIPQDIFFSYKYVFEKAGLKINSVQSEIVSFSILFEKRKRISQIFVDKKHTYLLDYKNGIFDSDKKFNISYSQFINDIKKNINVSELDAIKIFKKYGVLKTHKDARVLSKLERSMTPLFDFLKKRKIREKSSIYIHFSDTPIIGFTDRFKKFMKADVFELCVLCSSKYTFQDVLSIHKKDSYSYEALIARALAIYDKK